MATSSKQLGNSVCFVGSLFMDNNIEGLKWYLDNIHSKLVSSISGYQLIVAGNPKQKNVEWILDYPSVELVLLPSDAELLKIYEKSSVFISPMFHGAGVKLKTLNAISNNVAVVGTKVGCEGVGLIDGEHAFITDNIQDFYNGVCMLLTNDKYRQQMIEKSKIHVKKYFNKDYNKMILSIK